MSKVIFIAITFACSQFVQASALLSDDFNSSTPEPNPSWRFHDPFDTTAGFDEGESTLEFDGTNAIITVPEGLAHDLWKTPSTNKAPRLLQAAPNTDFQFEVKFETEPKVKHQLQGVIVQENDNSFLRFDIYYNISGVELFVSYINSATNSSTTYASAALPNFPNYRQIIRSGDNWTFRYSTDGISWTDVTFTHSMVVTEAGFFAGTVGVNPKFLSSVDYFIDLDEPIADNDTWTPPPSNAPPPVIDTWYGYTQPTAQYGKPGISQNWANILGNVSTEESISTLSYTVNGGLEQVLNFGPDNRRLVKKGDFNIEVDHSSLNVGVNNIEIKVKDSVDQEVSKVVAFSYDPGNIWPIPYTANWGSLSDINDVESIAHVVDGLWELTSNGIRTVQTGYDRSITIGDMTWSSDYVVSVPFTPHSEFAGIGLGVGWQGHEGDGSPKIEWPLQSLAWVRGPISNPSLEIITYGGLPPTGTWEDIQVKQPVEVSKNVTYILKALSEPLANGMSRFNVKFWPQNEAEPAAWNINAEIPTRDGSVALFAYNADVTFGNVNVSDPGVIIPPPPPPPPTDSTPPVISDIKVAVTNSSATVTWVTNESSNSVVNYGLSSTYGSNVDNSAQTTAHSLVLTGLNPNTDYHYQVKSVDGSNNSANSGDMVFSTQTGADITPPIISNLKVAITNPLAVVTWNTDEPSTSELNYGLDSNYGANIKNAALTTNHSLSLTLTDLFSNTDYFYQIKSADSSNNVATLTGIHTLLANKGIECLFNWAEQQYPDVLAPPLEGTLIFEDYKYRFYSSTNFYLGFFQNTKVHLLDANKSEGIVDVGFIQDYLILAGC